MSEPFLGQIMMCGFNFAPRGWALCDGQILPINQNQSLFSLLGTTYGGDGRTSFALPDLRGRAPTHFAGGFNLGTRTGEENHILTAGRMPNELNSTIYNKVHSLHLCALIEQAIGFIELQRFRVKTQPGPVTHWKARTCKYERGSTVRCSLALFSILR